MKFKEEDRVIMINDTLFEKKGTIRDAWANGEVCVRWDNYDYTIEQEKMLLKIYDTNNVSLKVSDLNKCKCDSRQLFNFGHDKGCTKL